MATTFDSLKSRANIVLSGCKTDEDIAAMKKEIDLLQAGLGSQTVSLSVTDAAAMIARVQAVKDRVSEIAADAQSEYALVDQISDMMINAAAAAATQSSADKRKGEAAMLASDYHFAKARSEAFYKYCISKMKNLDSRHESLSRVVTCMQLLMNNFGGSHRFSTSPDSSSQVRKGRMDELFENSDSSNDENTPAREIF
jgi:hypothetical protein